MPALLNKMPASSQEVVKGLHQLQQTAIPATTVTASKTKQFTEVAVTSCIIDLEEEEDITATTQKCQNCKFTQGPPPPATVCYGAELTPAPTDDLDPEKYSLALRSGAGGLAGLVEHLVIYPFDTIKTNRVTGLGKQLPINSLLDYGKWYGTRRAWAGVNCLIPACTIAHAFQFPCIEYSQTLLEEKKLAPILPSSFWAGMIGILPHDLVMNPANVVKQRMQQYTNTQKSSIQIARELYRKQGLGIFYRSFPVQYGVGATSMGIFYLFYNDLLVKYQNSLSCSKREFLQNHWYLSWFLRNTIATSVAVVATQPLDNVVTRVNTQYGGNGNGVTRWSAFTTLAKEGAFFTGLTARMGSAIPASILTWGTYEALKYSLELSKFS